jgi:hypothetical protein
MNGSHFQYIECDYCGESVWTNHPRQRFCNDRCRQDYHNQQHVPEESIDTKWLKSNYEIVRDATEFDRGGFVPGSRLGGEQELKYMLQSEALASGSIIKNLTTGQKYKVDYSRKKSKTYIIAECLIRVD